MPGRVSQDFGSSLARLYQKVEALEKANRELEKQVNTLTTRLDTKEVKEDKNQRQRALRAAFSQDKDEIKAARKNAQGITEQEILRMFEPVEPMTVMPFEINQTLLENMKADMVGARLPTIQIEIEEVDPEPYIFSNAYTNDSMITALSEAQVKAAESQRRFDEKMQQKLKEETNLLKRLSPMWQTELD